MNAQQGIGTESAHRVVVLGAGYAGMAAAVQLAARTKRRQGVQVTVVNAQERFTERLRLHMTATGQELAELTIGTVTYQGIDPADRKAELAVINGGLGMVFSAPDRVIATATFDFDADGRIIALHNVANPDKLQAVAGSAPYDMGTR